MSSSSKTLGFVNFLGCDRQWWVVQEIYEHLFDFVVGSNAVCCAVLRYVVQSIFELFVMVDCVDGSQDVENRWHHNQLVFWYVNSVVLNDRLLMPF